MSTFIAANPAALRSPARALTETAEPRSHGRASTVLKSPRCGYDPGAAIPTARPVAESSVVSPRSSTFAVAFIGGSAMM